MVKVHTPLPWTTGLYDASEDFKAIKTHVAVCRPDGSLLATCGPVDSDSATDAAYIVKAVNNFDNMKMFLKRALQILETDYPEENKIFIGQLKEAIVKAEAQS